MKAIFVAALWNCSEENIIFFLYVFEKLKYFQIIFHCEDLFLLINTMHSCFTLSLFNEINFRELSY